ncbi:MAG: hypothetical protein HOP31_12905 [Ignavibacteria bacterium]|nr:hypothetical protein [Ignavibacteria bacterium]
MPTVSTKTAFKQKWFVYRRKDYKIFTKLLDYRSDAEDLARELQQAYSRSANNLFDIGMAKTLGIAIIKTEPMKDKFINFDILTDDN